MATVTNTANETALRELLEKALAVYDVPESCILSAMSFINGLVTGAAQEKANSNKQEEKTK